MTMLLLSITIFLAVGFAFVLASLVAGWLIRPKVPSAMKSSIYECGEEVEELEAVQFGLRFYVVALFFLIFDVEVALLWPVAVVFREQAEVLLVIAGIFMLLIIAGFAYEWYSGSLDWIRATSTSLKPPSQTRQTGRPDQPLLNQGPGVRVQPVPAVAAASITSYAPGGGAAPEMRGQPAPADPQPPASGGGSGPE